MYQQQIMQQATQQQEWEKWINHNGQEGTYDEISGLKALWNQKQKNNVAQAYEEKENDNDKQYNNDDIGSAPAAPATLSGEQQKEDHFHSERQ